jgi:CNT family concentrative nucleoside transporter
MDIYNLISFLGIFVLAGFAWLCSSDRKVLNWRVIGWGIALQLFFALFIFVIPIGSTFFLVINNIVVKVLDSATAGTKFLFGRLAFLGLLALLDLVLGWFGGYLNHWFGLHFDWTLKSILGFVFYPFTLVVGVPPHDAMAIAKLVGERTVVTEAVAYQHLAQLMSQGAIANPRSALVAAYALCGFAHVASLAIFVGGTGALAPTRLKDLSRLGFRALLAATLACLQTAAVAGTFYTHGSILLGK